MTAGYNPHEPDRRDADQRATDATNERRERLERSMIAYFAKLMGDEDVEKFGGITFDEFTDDVWTVIERTNCLSDAFEQVKRERAAKLAAE